MSIPRLRGIVRPVVTLALIGALIAGFFIGKVPAEAFVQLVVSIASYWFATRPTGRNE